MRNVEYKEDGERGRNRTFNLLIKSYASHCGCEIDNCSRHNNLTTKRPAWTVFEIVGKVGEIEWHLIPKDTKRPQCIRRGPDARWETIAVKEGCQASWFRCEQLPHLPADGRSGLIHLVCPKNHHFTGSPLLVVHSKTEGAQSHGRSHRLPDAL